MLSGFYDTLWLQNGDLRAGDVRFAQRLPGKALSLCDGDHASIHQSVVKQMEG